ncbi:MAG: AmmeMemoRadiSam system protein B [Desulfococcaceae bacterium]|jgi:AmmeMemoRadiSam system protein B|nr:AmmeMemoRadiSam system protein B [Desulfococcaceae bacterium]
MDIRKAHFSGTWYPGTAGACENEIRQFLQQGQKEQSSKDAADSEPRGGIVPHAGWYFSGSIACNIIHALSRGQQPDTVILFGMHLHPDSPPVMMPRGAWETPFGLLPVAAELAAELMPQFSFRKESSQKFVPDNTVELQLPFIKYFFPEADILAIGVPPSETALKIAAALAGISAEQHLNIRVIGSTDLTHYGANYGFSPKGTGEKALEWVKEENDRKFIDTVISMNPSEIIREGLQNRNACCAGAAAAAVATAKSLGASRARSLFYASSHDKHPGDSFVGYAGILLS